MLSQYSQSTIDCFKRLLLIGFCISSLSCSSGLVYQNLDWVIPWYVDDYVSLNKQQSEEFDLLLEEALLWHKTQELPRYQQYLGEIANKLDKPLSEQDVEGIQTFLGRSFKAIQKELVPKVLPLTKSLSEEQQAEFWRNMDAKQTEFEEEFLPRTNKEYREDLIERYTAFSERLLGSLTEEQDLLIERKVSDAIRADDIWLKARKEWLDNIKRQYETDGPDWQSRMEQAWLDRDQYYSEEEKQTVDARDQQAKQILLTVINSRNDRQTRHFKEFLADWQSKFERWQR